MRRLFQKKVVIPALLLAGIGGAGVGVQQLIGSDHQQTAMTELNPKMDITDVYVFPGRTDDRIVLAMTVGSPISRREFAGVTGGQRANFDPNALYQFKIDNNQDGHADQVIQFSFDELTTGAQTVDVMGPTAPRDNGLFGSGVRDLFVTTTPTIRRGATERNIEGNLAASGAAAAGQIQVFAGLRDDPFWVDLEQFFRIIPDRRPTQGSLSTIGGVVPAPIGTIASTFRPRCTNGMPNQNQSQFNAAFGCAADFLRGLNALAIVVELPESQLTRGQGNGQLGIWATASR
ncbi:MAG: DUF4331 domain-containing protein [Gemmatimonadetes bacterium]|nr:DUF4331 domain-containing protein [Gemmatimonadota bacterium]